MSTITLSRQMGSLGSQIAQCAAQALGYRLVWRDAINQAARLSGAPEIALAAIDELGLLDVRPSAKAYQAYRSSLAQVMAELADQGNTLILGRAGQVILGERPDVLHVRVVAPLALRIERVASQYGISLEAAKARIEASDHYRANFLMKAYKVRWEDPLFYHLVINTGLFSQDQAVALILHASQEIHHLTVK